MLLIDNYSFCAQDSLNESTNVELLCNCWFNIAMLHCYFPISHHEPLHVSGPLQGSDMDTVARILTLLWHHHCEDVSCLLHH